MPNFPQISKKTAFLLSLAVFFLVLDRLLKFLSINKIIDRKELLGKLLCFNFVPNPYIAFSLPLGGFLLIIAIFLIIFYLIFLFLQNKNPFVRFSLFLIILGASSNLFDRIKYSFVIDYIDLKYFTVFNIADAMISAGAFLLLFILIKNPRLFE